MTTANNTVHAAALGMRGQRVALLRDGDNWSLPMAPVPQAHSPEQAALRALQERVGLPAAIDRVSGIYAGESGLLVVYAASLDAGEPRDCVAFFEPHALPAPIVPALHVAALAEWAAGFLQGLQATRFCPRCGSSRLSLQEKYGRPRMTCATCGFVFFRDPKVGAGVLLEDGGRVLLIRRGVNPGMDLWCLPSGFIEHDESPETAAVREAKEETGLDVELGELMGLQSYYDPMRGNGILILYRARALGGTLAPGDDAAEARYFAPGELPAPGQIAFRTHRLILAEWRAQRERAGV